MSISPFAIKNPASFGFDTPGLATANPRSAIDGSAVESKSHPTAPLSPEPASARPVDPMLLVYQERVETFRMIARVARGAVSALLGRRSGRAVLRPTTPTLAVH